MVLGKQSHQGYESNLRYDDKVRVEIFPGSKTLDLLEEIQKLIKDLQCEIEHFNDRIIFRSMYNDIDTTRHDTNAYSRNRR